VTVKILRPYGLGWLLLGPLLLGPVLLGPLLLALAGCTGRPAVADRPTPTGPAPARYQGPLRAPVTYPGLGIELRPPTVLTAPISWQQAYSGACSRGEALCQPGLSPTIVLADATLTNSSLTVSNPVYVITSTDVPCYPTGPGPRSDTTPAPASASLCLQITLIDARTGQFAYGASGTAP
jgi:hypothetical protein